MTCAWQCAVSIASVPSLFLEDLAAHRYLVRLGDNLEMLEEDKCSKLSSHGNACLAYTSVQGLPLFSDFRDPCRIRMAINIVDM